MAIDYCRFDQLAVSEVEIARSVRDTGNTRREIRRGERVVRWRMAYSQKERRAFSKPPEIDSEDAIIVDEVGNRGIKSMTDDLPACR
jgi:hypothetical protein